jgi:hypothetical protein
VQIPADMAGLKDAEIAAALNVSRTAVLYARRRAAGVCERCGKPRSATSTAFCAKHAKKVIAEARKRHGNKPWRPGGRGRPPFSAATATPSPKEA